MSRSSTPIFFPIACPRAFHAHGPGMMLHLRECYPHPSKEIAWFSLRRRGFDTALALCWWYPYFCKILWGNRSCIRRVGGCPPTSWSCSERWEDKHFDDAEPTPSRTCITWRDNCGDFGTRPCAQVVGLYDKHSHGWQPRAWFGTPPSKLHPRLFFFFFFFLIRLVYGDTWAGKANGVINLAAQNKKRELSSAT